MNRFAQILCVPLTCLPVLPLTSAGSFCKNALETTLEVIQRHQAFNHNRFCGVLEGICARASCQKVNPRVMKMKMKSWRRGADTNCKGAKLFLHVLHLGKCAFNKPQLCNVLKSMSSMSFGRPRSFTMLLCDIQMQLLVCKHAQTSSEKPCQLRTAKVIACRMRFLLSKDSDVHSAENPHRGP